MESRPKEPLYALNLGQNNPVHSSQNAVNLTVTRVNRRRSIEDNILMPNVKFVSPQSRTYAKALDPGSKTDRVLNNDTYNSRMQTEDETNAFETSQHQSYEFDMRNSHNASALGPDNSRKLLKNSTSGLGPPHHKSNRSYDMRKNRYSPVPENTYK